VSEYCSDTLLPILKDKFEIETFSGTFSTPYPWIKHNHYLNAYKRHRENPFDLFFYQLEDGIPGRFVRTQLGMMPGVTWVHDIFLGDLGAEATHTSPWEHTISQFHDVAVPFSDRGHLPHQLRPHAYREVSVSPVVLFDSHWALKEFSSLVSNRIEHALGAHRGDYMPIPVMTKNARLRRKNDGALSVVSACSPGIEGHPHKILQALGALKHPWNLTWMVSSDEMAKARQVVEEFGAQDNVTFIEGRESGAWEKILEHADVALHLRNSPFGHLGPYLHLSLAMGVPCVVLRAAAGEELPHSAVFSVEGGMFETAQLVGIFEAISRGDAVGCGEAGRRFIQCEAAAGQVAQRLGDLFAEVAPTFVPVLSQWEELYEQAYETLVAEIEPLVELPASQGPSPFELLVKPFVDEVKSFATDVASKGWS
jgi:hypothetical protein